MSSPVIDLHPWVMEMRKRNKEMITKVITELQRLCTQNNILFCALMPL